MVMTRRLALNWTERNKAMKLCIDCKWCQRDGWFERMLFGDKYAKCKKGTRVSPVDGSAKDYCDVERAGYRQNDCGPDAKHFEPKQS